MAHLEMDQPARILLRERAADGPHPLLLLCALAHVPRRIAVAPPFARGAHRLRIQARARRLPHLVVEIARQVARERALHQVKVALHPDCAAAADTRPQARSVPSVAVVQRVVAHAPRHAQVEHGRPRLLQAAPRHAKVAEARLPCGGPLVRHAERVHHVLLRLLDAVEEGGAAIQGATGRRLQVRRPV